MGNPSTIIYEEVKINAFHVSVFYFDNYFTLFLSYFFLFETLYFLSTRGPSQGHWMHHGIKRLEWGGVRTRIFFISPLQIEEVAP